MAKTINSDSQRKAHSMSMTSVTTIRMRNGRCRCNSGTRHAANYRRIVRSILKLDEAVTRTAACGERTFDVEAVGWCVMPWGRQDVGLCYGQWRCLDPEEGQEYSYQTDGGEDTMSADSEEEDAAIAEDSVVVNEDGRIEHPKFKRLHQYIAGGITRIWITGDAGLGKTTACEMICEDLGWKLFILTPVDDKYELFGSLDANGVYHETELYRWATYEGKAVLLMDEIDGNDPGALIAMNAVLANGVAVFPMGQVKIADDKIVLATANTTGEGATMQYSARQAQDGALIDRFEIKYHWGLHEPTERAIALAKTPGSEKSVTASWKIRKNLERYGVETTWGPRRTYALCRAVSCGVPVREAAYDVGLSCLSDFDQNHALEGVN